MTPRYIVKEVIRLSKRMKSARVMLRATLNLKAVSPAQIALKGPLLT